jgi:tetratricopeptide (TPR) repeat protein
MADKPTPIGKHLTVVPESPPVSLGFSINLIEGRGLLSLEKATLFEVLHIDNLKMEILNLTFPVEISRGAEAFRDTLCEVNDFQFSLFETELNRFIRERLDYSSQGFEQVQIHFLKNQLMISGSYLAEKGPVNFTIKGFFSPEEGGLRISLHDFRTYGWLPFPPPYLAAKLTEPLEEYFFKLLDCSSLLFDPFLLFFSSFLPQMGWRAPRFDSLSLKEIELSRGRFSLKASSELTNGSPLKLQEDININLLKLREEQSFFQEGEELLSQGKISTAAHAYELRRSSYPQYGLAVERLCQIYGSDADTFSKALGPGSGYLKEEPNCIPILNTLASIYYAQEDWEKSATYYEKLVERAEEEGVTPDIIYGNLVLGEIWSKIDPAKSSTTYEKVLKVDFKNQSALKALGSLYRRQGEHQKALWSYEQLIEMSEDKAQTLSFQIQIGKVYEEELSQWDEAISAYQKALEHDANYLPAWEALASTFLKQEDFSRAIRTYDRLIPKYLELSDYDKAASFQVAIGRIWEKNLSRVDNAILRYSRALEILPEQEEALERLAGLYARQRAWPKVLEVCEGMLRSALNQGDQARVLGLLYTIGKLWQEKLKNVEKAVAHYQQITLLDPKYLPALEVLAQIYSQQEDWTSLVSIYQQQLEAIEDPSRLSSIYFSMGMIQEEKLSQINEAIIAYRESLNLAPSFLPAWRSLSDIYRKEARWEDLLQLYQERVSSIKEKSQTMLHLMEMGELLRDKLAEPERAILSYRQVLRINPGHVPALKALAGIYRGEARWAEYLEVLESQAGLSKESSQIVSLSLEMGGVLETQLKEPGQAIAKFEQALAREPACEPARKILARLYQQEERWEELIKLYQGELGLTEETGRRFTLYYEIGQLLDSRLSQPAEAENYLKKSLEIDPSSRPALQSLTKLYYREEKWRELTEALTRQIEIAGDRSEQLSLYHQLGIIWKDKLTDLESAVSSFSEALKVDPDYLPSLDELTEIYWWIGDWAGLAKIYEKMASVYTDPSIILSLQLRLGRIEKDRFYQLDRALASFSQALQIDPQCLEALEGMAEIHREVGNWQDWIQVTEMQAHLLKDDRQVIRLHQQIAQVWDEKLSHPERAIQKYSRILELEPDFLPALKSLSELYQRESNWEELVEIYGHLARVVDDDFQAARYHYQAGKLWLEKLSGPDLAISSLRQALELDPSFHLAFDDLKLIYRNSEDWESLLDLIQQQVKVAADPEQLPHLYWEMGQVLEENLGRSQEAITQFEEALKIDPSYSPALASLEKICRRDERWEDLIRVYERKAGVEKDNYSLHYELAKLWEEKFHREDKALKEYQETVKRNPRYLPALESLAKIYFKKKRWEELAGIFGQQAEVLGATEEGLSFLMGAGEIWDKRLSRPDQAIDSYQRALSLSPYFAPALESIKNIYLREERWEEFIESAEKIVTTSEDKTVRFELLLKMAEILEKELARIGEAIKRYQRAVEIEPDHIVSRENLAELLSREGHLEEAKLNYEHLLEILPETESEKTLEVNLNLARIEEQLGIAEAAMQRYQRVIELKPESLDALKSLGDLLYRESRWVMARSIYAKFLESFPASEDLPTAVEITCRAAEIEEKLGRNDNAIKRYQQVIELDGNHLPAWENLAQLHYQAKRWQLAKSAYERWLAFLPQEGEGPNPVTAYFRLGEIEEKVGNPDKAIIRYQKALELEPGSAAALEASIRLYRRQENWEDLIRSYHAQLKTTSDPSQVFSLHYEIGQILEEKVLRMEEAASSYRRALEVNPTFRPVLERLYSIYLWLEDREKGAEILSQLVRLEKDPEKLKKYHLALGDIYEKWLFDEAKAAHHYQELLKIEPHFAQAQEALSRVYEQLEDWQSLAPLHKEMLDALPENSPEIIPLSLKLAEIYTQRLSDFKSAETLLRRLLAQNPEDPEVHFALGELYDQHESSSDKAIEQYLWTLNRQPLRIGAYRALARLYDRLGLTEQALITYSLLIILDPQSKDAERRFMTKPPSPPFTRGRVLDDRRREKYLIHPAEKSPIRQILYPIAEYLPQWGSTKLGSFKLEQAHLVNEGFNPSLKRVWDDVAMMLNPPTASLYLEDQGKVDRVHLNLEPSAIIFNLAFLRSLTEKEARFVLGRSLEHLKNKHHFFQVLAEGEIRRIITLLRSMSLSKTPVTGVVEFQEKILKKMLKSLGQAHSDKSGKKVASIFKSLKEDKLPGWLKSLEHTANRAGLLACLDPLAAFSALIKFRLKREDVSSELRDKGLGMFLKHNENQLLEEEILELLKFCISPEYLLLRRELGIR